MTASFSRAVRATAFIPCIVFAGMTAVYTAVDPELFTTFQLQTVANQIAPVAFVALAQLVVVLTGGIDISVAALVSLVNVVAVRLMDHHASPLIACLAAVAIGALAGGFNGALVVLGRMPAVVVTLATAFILGALALALLDRPGGTVPMSVVNATSGTVAGIPVGFLWVAGAAGLLWLLLQRTVLGRVVYGVGSSDLGVDAAGLPGARVRLFAWVLSGTLTGLAAVLLVGSAASGDPRSGDPYLLVSIAAVALGGAGFAGGVGSIAGTLAGAATLGLVGNLLFFVGVDSYWQYVVSAAIIMVAIGLPAMVRIAGTRLKARPA